MIRLLMAVFVFAVLALSATLGYAQNTAQPAQAITVNVTDTDVPESSYLELDSALDANCTSIMVYNSTSKVIYLAVGAAASEQRVKYDFPPSASAVHHVKLPLVKGTRLAARAVGAAADSGFLTFNCLQ